MKIKNIADFNNAETKYNLKKIPVKEVKVVSVDDFYDGPLSGECQWQDRNYYYMCYDRIDPVTDTDVWPRKYLLLSLSNEQLEQVRHLAGLFNKSPGEEHLKIYNAAPALTIERDQIAGWFDSMRLKQEWE